MSNIPFQSNRVSLDQKGHCENASCTWAPPASPTNFNASSSTIESLTKDSPAREDLPPLYNLPNRSTHTYEDECRVHHGSGVCHRHHCEGAPRKEETQPQSKPTFQRTNSWNMEDQKRLQHMRLLGSANVQDTNPCDC